MTRIARQPLGGRPYHLSTRATSPTKRAHAAVMATMTTMLAAAAATAAAATAIATATAAAAAAAAAAALVSRTPMHPSPHWDTSIPAQYQHAFVACETGLSPASAHERQPLQPRTFVSIQRDTLDSGPSLFVQTPRIACMRRNPPAVQFFGGAQLRGCGPGVATARHP